MLVKVIILILLGLAEQICSADSSVREIDEHFIEERRTQSSIFKTLPGTHITPVNNRLIFTLMLSTLDAKVRSQEDAPKETLEVTGYGLAPYVAISGKHFGFGLSGEIGQGWSKYREFTRQYVEKSSLFYQGFGAQAFYTPTGKKSTTRLTFVASAHTYKAHHKASSNRPFNEYREEEWRAEDYNITRGRLGTNFEVRFSESFSVIPWVNLTYTNADDIEKKIKKTDDEEAEKFQQRFAGDTEIFWRPGSYWEYGLDAALRYERFEIHFGNMLGSAIAAASQKKSSERINNNTYTISVIFLTPTSKPAGI